MRCMQVKSLLVKSMQAKQPQYSDPAWRSRIGMLAAFICIILPMLWAAEFTPWQLFNAQSVKATANFVGTFFPPKLDAAFLYEVAIAAWQTVAIATLGVALGWLLGVPLAILACTQLSVSALATSAEHPKGRMARLPWLIRSAARWLLIALRSVPELVWALLFVRVVGLGATAGVLAIALTYGGMLGKVYAEILDSTDPAPVQAMLRNGSGRLQALLYAATPACAPAWLSYTVFRWECAIRGSIIMGFVGAGGLGQMMDISLKQFAGNEVATLLIVFMLLVGVADWLSRRVKISWLAVTLLLGACALTMPLDIAAFTDPANLARMVEFLRGFIPPETAPVFLHKLGLAALETIAMSAIGTLLACFVGLMLALPASSSPNNAVGFCLRWLARLILNFLRAVPELIWALILIIAAGLGPLAGTLALAAHTVGILGRLFADTFDKIPQHGMQTLRHNGANRVQVFLYAQLPQALPQLISYILYRWENNIRAAAILGVVGAGGLGQMLKYHLSLFQMPEAASVILAMLCMIVMVDASSVWLRRKLS